MAFYAVKKRRSAYVGQQKPIEAIEEKKGRNLLKKLNPTSEVDPKDEAGYVLRYNAPTSLDELMATTNFDRKEIKLLYRSFKEAFPLGRMTADHLCEAMAVPFRGSDVSSYAQILFNKFDVNANGSITFDEFIRCLSIVNRGNDREKLEWIFDLYDLDQDEILDFNDVCRFLTSVHKLFPVDSDRAYARQSSTNSKESSAASESKESSAVHDEKVVIEANLFLRKFDTNNQGFVQKDDFVRICLEDNVIISNLTIFSMPCPRTCSARMFPPRIRSESEV